MSAECSKCGADIWDECYLCKIEDQLQKSKQREAVLLEAVKWYTPDSINHHGYHAMMDNDLTKVAKQALEKYKELKNG